MKSRHAVLAVLSVLALLDASMLAAAQAPSTSRAFQIILLSASQQGSSSLQDLPPGAQKALEDVRQFLPYKSYTLSDMAWLRSSARAQAQLKGPNGKEYHLSFTFREAGSAAGKRLSIDSFSLNPGLDHLPSAPPAVEPGYTPPPTRSLISTSFDLQVGETVVVGVSKADRGDHALIVLLTAVP